VTANRRVLVAEDDDSSRRLLADALTADGFEVVEAQDGFELVKQIAPAIGAEQRQVRLDLIISSVRLPGWWAVDVIAKLSQHMLLPPLILLVGPGDEPLRHLAGQLRGAVIFDRPADVGALLVLARTIVP
jgi:two-component system, OmpR family, phosphate regulon response regulator PhoB